MYTRFLTASLFALCAGCATTDTAPLATATTTVAEPAKPKTVKAPERRFPDDSLFPLLVAEFALRRQDFPTALQHYMQQAPVLRDPGVSAHTTRLAQYMHHEKQALEAAQLWAKLTPQDTDASKAVAVLLARQGDITKALDHMEELSAQGEEPPYALLATQFEKRPLNEQNAIIDRLTTIIGNSETQDQPLLARAFMYESQGKLPLALTDIQQLLERTPDNQQAVLLEAKLLQDTDAKAPFSRLQSLLEKQPDNTRIRLHYARLLTRTDLLAARKQYEILSAQSPHNGELLLSLALVNREMDDDITARAYLKQMVALNTLPDQAHFHLGWLEEDLQQPQQAAHHYSAVKEGRLFMRTQRRHGRMLLEAGKNEAFQQLFAQQRHKHKWLEEQLYGLQTNLLMSFGYDQQALEILTESLYKHPKSAGLRYARAMLYDQMNNLAAMEADLRFIIANEPNSPTALNALGYTLINHTDRLTEAAELVQRALTLAPDEPAILDSMGWLKYRMGDYEEALSYLKRAYSAFPDPEVAAHLGEVLWMTGQREAARQIWQEALTKDGTHQILRETIQRLQQVNSEP